MLQAFSWVGWNVFLAVIPVILACVIQGIFVRTKERPSFWTNAVMTVLGIVWLAFVPNTCYLFTEWRHFLDTVGSSNLWATWQDDPSSTLHLIFYVLFYLIYSGIGVLTFALAIRPMANIARRTGAMLWVWGIPFFMLMASGVYLGLILRFNSWDLMNRYDIVLQSAVQILHRPLLFSFVALLAGFLWVVYFAADVWIDGFTARWNSIRQCGAKNN